MKKIIAILALVALTGCPKVPGPVAEECAKLDKQHTDALHALEVGYQTGKTICTIQTAPVQ